MILEVVIFFITLIVMTFLGYAFHMMFHKPWSGRFYQAHMNHHLKQYPPSNFTSEGYRDSGKDNTVYLFILVFSPFVLTVLGLALAHVISIFLGVSVIIEMIAIGWLNNSIHDSSHLKNTFWHKFKFFDRLIRLHYYHHVNMGTNYGIFSFTWDKIFGTYKDH